MFFKKSRHKPDESYDALVAAFCLVSFADGQLHMAELTRFIRIIAREYPDMKLDEDRLIHDVINYGKLLSEDFAAGKIKALKTIAKVKGQPATADRILKISQIAIVSDNQIAASEEGIMADIVAALER